MPPGLDHSKRNDKSCQKSCLPWQDAGSVVLAIAHPRPSLHRGHHTCLFKAQVWLSPSCPGTCLIFPLETKKFIFPGVNWGAKRGATARRSNPLFLSTVNAFERLVPNSEHVLGTCPLMSQGLAWCWRPHTSLLHAWVSFPGKARHRQRRSICGQISSWCKFRAQLGLVEFPLACVFLIRPMYEACHQRHLKCQNCLWENKLCGTLDVF